MVPDTDFPDVRAQSFVHSHDGTLFVIPREHDRVRLYIQQGPDSDVVDPATGRADKRRTSPETLLEQGRKILRPYRMEARDGGVEWWTVYVGACFCSGGVRAVCDWLRRSSSTRGREVLARRACVHRGRRVPHALAQGR